MLSAVILARNEEKNIARAIQSLAFCDEIIVLDDYSSDQTVAIAQQSKVIVRQRALNNNFADQRNAAMDLTLNDWVLFIDADEEVSPELQKSILQAMSSSGVNTAYYLRRRDHFWGNTVTHGEVATAYRTGFIRLIKKGSGKWQGAVHETFQTQAKTAVLEGYIDHYAHENITEFLQSVNYYSSVRAQELNQQGHKASVWELLILPFAKFFYTYFIKFGFKDGPAGFAYSFFMSFHSFLVRAKLYQYQHATS